MQVKRTSRHSKSEGKCCVSNVEKNVDGYAECF